MAPPRAKSFRRAGEKRQDASRPRGVRWKAAFTALTCLQSKRWGARPSRSSRPR